MLFAHRFFYEGCFELKREGLSIDIGGMSKSRCYNKDYTLQRGIEERSENCFSFDKNKSYKLEETLPGLRSLPIDQDYEDVCYSAKYSAGLNLADSISPIATPLYFFKRNREFGTVVYKMDHAFINKNSTSYYQVCPTEADVGTFVQFICKKYSIDLINYTSLRGITYDMTSFDVLHQRSDVVINDCKVNIKERKKECVSYLILNPNSDISQDNLLVTVSSLSNKCKKPLFHFLNIKAKGVKRCGRSDA